jgi:hypothetical protein
VFFQRNNKIPLGDDDPIRFVIPSLWRGICFSDLGDSSKAFPPSADKSLTINLHLGGTVQMSIGSVGGGSDIAALISQSAQAPVGQAAAISVLKTALSSDDSTAASLVAQISQIGNSGGRLNVYA